MEKIGKEAIHLVGIALKKKTINANGQSSIDCGSLHISVSRQKGKCRIV